MQNWLVGIALLGAMGYLVWRWRRSARKSAGQCGSCAASSRPTAQPR